MNERQRTPETGAESCRRETLRTRAFGFGARWELRVGPENRFRVFYRIDRKIMRVNILAIGEKRGERLFIGGEVVRL